MDFKPIQQQKIYEQIVDQIKAMILKGSLKPGDRLPSERDLAETFNVSRASVREALSALHLLGLIEIKPGEGTYMKQSDLNSVIHLLTLLLPMGSDTASEIAQVRKALEVEAAGLAAMNANESDIEALERIIQGMEQELNTEVLGEISDWNFHFAIATATENSLFIKLMNTISDVMQKTILKNRESLFRNRENQLLLYRQHLAVYLAVKNHDPELARRKMYEHLKNAEDEIEKMSQADLGKDT